MPCVHGKKYSTIRSDISCILLYYNDLSWILLADTAWLGARERLPHVVALKCANDRVQICLPGCLRIRRPVKPFVACLHPLYDLQPSVAIPTQSLDDRPGLSTEDKDAPVKWIELHLVLYQQCQCPGLFPHVGVARMDVVVVFFEFYFHAS